MVTRFIMTSVASSPVSSAALIWLARMMRMNPNRSANAPARIVSTTVGRRSAKAMTPSHALECVSSQASQPTAVRYIQRPMEATECPIQ